jgi:integrase/recombinase XerC
LTGPPANRPHTQGYRQDFTAVADPLTSGRPAHVALIDITKDTMRAAFAAYASTHEPASIRGCWSTWNVLCDFLYTAELIPANPMPFVGRPKAAKTLPAPSPNLRSPRGESGRASPNNGTTFTLRCAAP